MATCTEYPSVSLEHSNRTYFRGFSSNNGFRGRESIAVELVNGRWLVQQITNSSSAGVNNYMWSHLAPALGEALAPNGPRLLDTLAVAVPAGVFRRTAHFYAGDFRDSTQFSYLRHFYLTRGVGFTKLVYANVGSWELMAYRLNR